MDFKYLDNFFRASEKEETRLLPGGFYYILRVDGKNFSKMTRKNFKKPFDSNFKNLMIETIKEVMEKHNYNIIFAYTQSDEISFLFNSRVVNLKERKVLSLIPAAISAVMSVKFNKPVVFDGRIIPIDNQDDVIKYFAWRHLDSRRNSLNNIVYWTAILNNNCSKTQANSILKDKSYNEKLDYLKSFDIDYTVYPTWATNGSCLFFETYQKDGFNPLTQEVVKVDRRRLVDRPVADEDDIIKTVQAIVGSPDYDV